MNRTKTLLLAGCLVASTAAGTAQAQSRVAYNENPNSVRLRFGEFKPAGESIYWEQREFDFFGTADDWEDSSGGLDFQHLWNERMGFTVGVSEWEGGQLTSFRDFTDADGFEISHEADLDITRLDFGVVFYPLRRNARISPYFGGGGSLTDYALRESGDFIDFDTFDVSDGTFETDGDTTGWFWLLGVEVTVMEHLGVFAEARWYNADDNLRDAFQDFGSIDLGGRDLSFGASVRF